MKTYESPSVAIITPTTGAPELKQALESVHEQTHTDVLHLIIVDGDEFAGKTDNVLRSFRGTKYKRIVIPFNTGNGLGGLKFNGHRIYAGLSYLVNSRYVFFLDEDNWFERDHVSSLTQLIEDEGLDWAYSLRKIYDRQGNYVANDDCENLGRWPPFSRRGNLVDTSCYAIRREVLTAVGHTWYHPLGADRHFFRSISAAFGKFKTTGLYTVNYRLHDNRPPTADFFLSGNEYMRKKYGTKLPWNS